MLIKELKEFAKIRFNKRNREHLRVVAEYIYEEILISYYKRNY